jgi:uncharacterized protein (DUF849 family)
MRSAIQTSINSRADAAARRLKGKARGQCETGDTSAQIIEGLGLEIASPDEARDILQLKGGDKVAF